MITTGPVIRITEQECRDRIVKFMGGDFNERDLLRPSSFAGVVAVLQALGLIDIERQK